MQNLDLMEMSARGDNDFASLNDIEKGLYVLFLFYTLRDMEGITHFYSHHADHLPRLVALLASSKATNAQAINELTDFLREKSGGSWNNESLDDFFSNISDEDNRRIAEWDREYDILSTEMWDQVREYTRQCYDTTFD